MANTVIIGPLLRGYRETFGKNAFGSGYVKSADLPYLIQGADSPDAARAFALASVPEDYQSCKLTTVDIDKQVGEYDYEITAHYALPPSTEFKENPDKTFTFDFSTTTVKMKFSKAQIARYGDKASATVGNALGVEEDGKVKGIDMPVLQAEFTETHWFTDKEMTQTFRNTLMDLVDKNAVNNAPFRGLAAGEVRVLGISGSRRGDDWDDPWEVTYKFGVSKNVTGLFVGDIGPISKKGWEYLDIVYETQPGTTIMLPKAVAVYVHKIFDTADFSTLGIGTT